MQNAGASAPLASEKQLVRFLLALFGVPCSPSAYGCRKSLPSVPEYTIPFLDPGTLTFARAVYSITPSNTNELALVENEIIAITGKLVLRTGAEVDPRTKVEGK